LSEGNGTEQLKQNAAGSATLREIQEQPQAWRRSLDILRSGALTQSLAANPPWRAEWVFFGCGTSFYLAQSAAASFSMQTGAVTRALPASELLFYPDAVLDAGEKPGFPVLISRSGMTSEVLRAARLLRERNIPFLGVTCDGGELATLSPFTLRLDVPERSTVMTASFTSMLLALQFVAASFHVGSNLAVFDELPVAAGSLLKQNTAQMQELGERPFANYVFLGQGPLFGIAQECALKVTESSCSYTQSYHTLEFRHGPKSIVAPEVLITFLLSDAAYDEEVELLREVKELGATTLVVANALAPDLRQFADYAVELNTTVPEALRSCLYTIPAQLLACYTGLRKGFNPDAPRNLTRVVLLEN
jgi:glucosamine--fructose-6-phosphate aminotransferase (isomerizing)